MEVVNFYFEDYINKSPCILSTMKQIGSGGRAAGRERSKRGSRVGRFLVVLSLLLGASGRDAQGRRGLAEWATAPVVGYPGNDLGRLLR